MRILNTEKEDYHIHSLNYSDGLNTIDEIARYAGEIGMTKIVITDHSQATLDRHGFPAKCFRTAIHRWRNVHNIVEVSFGVEADLLDEKGTFCSHIGGIEGEFVILSYHPEIYSGDKGMIAQGFINAIRRHYERIDIIGHLAAGLGREDIIAVVQEANRYNIPLEVNGKYFLSAPDSWDTLLQHADRIYVNSDTHTLSDLRDRRREVFRVLRQKGHLAKE
jgi:histidinol phosphatase-like PHP family hydrolase